MKVRMVILVAGMVALGGCSFFERSTPDEFKVVARAPLELPPDFQLRPPQPGTPRPQELARDNRASATVFGASAGLSATDGPPIFSGKPASSSLSGGEVALLSQAGAEYAEADIRAIVDHEAPGRVIAERSFLDRLLFWKDDGKADTGRPLIQRQDSQPIK